MSMIKAPRAAGRKRCPKCGCLSYGQCLRCPQVTKQATLRIEHWGEIRTLANQPHTIDESMQDRHYADIWEAIKLLRDRRYSFDVVDMRDRKPMRNIRTLALRDLTPEQCAKLRIHEHKTDPRRRKAYLYIASIADGTWQFDVETELYIEAGN